MNNKAAWLMNPKAKPLKVDSAPSPKPGKNEVVLKVAYAAVNPVDWKIQDTGMIVKTYPMVLGSDVAGEIVEVGEGVANLEKGMRVMAATINLLLGKPEYGAYQLYCLCNAALVSPVPDSVPLEQAVVLPLAICTAAAGLYESDKLALPHPTNSPKPSGKTVLVWGGSSSVGCAAIQLAVASGLDVFTTASSRNQELCKSLGASQVFDHTQDSVVDDIVSALKGREYAGAYDSISSQETLEACEKIASQVGGVDMIASTNPDTGGVKAKAVFGPVIMYNEVGPAVWGKFVPGALQDGSLKCKPDPMVIGGGLDKVQEGIDTLKQGVSAKKVVIKIQGE